MLLLLSHVPERIDLDSDLLLMDSDYPNDSKDVDLNAWITARQKQDQYHSRAISRLYDVLNMIPFDLLFLCAHYVSFRSALSLRSVSITKRH